MPKPPCPSISPTRYFPSRIVPGFNAKDSVFTLP